jgi:hypothetical protein
MGVPVSKFKVPWLVLVVELCELEDILGDRSSSSFMPEITGAEFVGC